MKIMFKIFTVILMIAASSVASAFSIVDCSVASDRLALGGGLAELDQDDCEFLDQIYSDTNPAGWVDSTNWDTLSDVSTWFGVTRVGTEVSGIFLQNNSLAGDVSLWSFAGMDSMTSFDVSLNNLSGDISSWDISNLSLLETFTLQNNSLSGDISSWDISNLSLLQNFNLQNNSLSGDLTLWDISNLLNLERFFLALNNFSGDLTLWDISGLVSLNTFYINNNNFTGNLSSWVLPVNLERIFLNSNSFSGDISSWVLPANLADLRLQINNFSGDVGMWVLPSGLVNLFIRSNQFNSDISSWVLPSTLVNFQIHRNDFFGDISSWVLPTSGMSSFVIAENNFEADISSWIIPADLNSLNLSDNAFFGNIPDFTSAASLVANSSAINFNKFITDDLTNDAAADSALGEDWSAFQTVAPMNPTSNTVSTTTAEVSVDSYEYISNGDFVVRWGTTQGGSYASSTTVARSGGTDIQVSGLLPDTFYFGVVEATTPANAGGNVLVATSTEFLLLLQTTIPDLATSSDDGISDADNITTITTPRIEGECITGSIVEVEVDGVATGDTGLCTAGVFDITLTNPLLAGSTYEISITQTDTTSGLTSGSSQAIDVTIDQDTDSDGFTDAIETAAGSDPALATSVPTDTDGDGYPDYVESNIAAPVTDENDPSSFPVSPDPLANDTDGDGYPDWLEVAAGSDPALATSVPTDTDGDAVPDIIELMQSSDPNVPLDYRDTDGDLVPDYIEVRDGTDSNDATVGGFLDTDGDLVPDYVEITRQVNNGQAATDENNIDIFNDTDGGGVPDYVEVTLFVNEGLLATDPADASDDNRDTDGRNGSDYLELKRGTDPLVATGGSGGSTPRACKDPEATNYTRYGREDNRLCTYSDEQDVENTDSEPSNTEPSDSLDALGTQGFRFTKDVSRNSVNDMDEVNRIIQFLNEYEGESLSVDGSYDADDFEAIKRFQTKYRNDVLTIWGLSEPTGFVGITTRLKMNVLSNNITVGCPFFREFNSVTRNSASEEVRQTKNLLSSLGFYNGEINSVFDINLDRAVRSFQETFSTVMLKPWSLTGGTGYKYQSTNKFMNFLVGCNERVTLDNGVVLDY